MRITPKACIRSTWQPSLWRAPWARPRPGCLSCWEENDMTKELELEQTAPDEAPKPKLVESKPATHNARKHRISRWLAVFTILGIAAGGTAYWRQSRGFETTDDAQVDGHFD